MALLTDRTLALSSAITPTTLIHIVTTGDTSQNPAGSSYKAELGQLIPIFSADTYVTGGTFSEGIIVFTNNSGGTFSVTGITDTLISVTEISTTPFLALLNYDYYGVTFSGITDITIPDANGIDGHTVKFKDERGTAATYPITITPALGTIDGNPFVTIAINYMSLTLVARNNNWWII